MAHCRLQPSVRHLLIALAHRGGQHTVGHRGSQPLNQTVGAFKPRGGVPQLPVEAHELLACRREMD
eukprot:4894349-Prymnesium_polylepis.1